MAKYIDIDKLSKMIQAKADTLIQGKEAFYYIANWLNKLPAADVVKVVRCGQCGNYCKNTGECNLYGRYPNENDFCSSGKRK